MNASGVHRSVYNGQFNSVMLDKVTDNVCQWSSLKCKQLLLYLDLREREWISLEFIEMYTIKGQLVLHLGLGDSYGCH